jgi:hypothetical protein
MTAVEVSIARPIVAMERPADKRACVLVRERGRGCRAISMQVIDTVVVGASAAGLASAACLSRARVPLVLLEREPQVAGAWRRHYRRLRLHTSKAFSGLPHLPFPPEVPKYPLREHVVEYLEAYTQRMGLSPRFGEGATSIRRDGDAWVTQTPKSRYRSRNVVVATGYTRVPNRPTWPGQEGFAGDILHSSDYRDGEPWRGKRVLVVGLGNSGGEIALDLLEHDARPTLSVRSPVNVVPRDFLGLPILAWGIALSKLPLPVADGIAAIVSRITIGRLEQLGLRKLPYGPLTQLQTKGRIPLLDVGTAAQIRARQIDVLPGPSSFTPGGVVLEGVGERPFDAVVLATGFRPALHELLGPMDSLLDDDGAPRKAPPTGMYFCGFHVGPGMLRVIGREAERIAASISARLPQ